MHWASEFHDWESHARWKGGDGYAEAHDGARVRGRDGAGGADDGDAGARGVLGGRLIEPEGGEGGGAAAPPPSRLYLEHGDLRLYHGDARAVLRELPAGSVHCVVTSPPYWGLRSYGTPPVVWGGDPEHDHEWGAVVPGRKIGGGTGQTTLMRDYRSDDLRQQNQARAVAASSVEGSPSSYCDCGAWLGELGQEPTPQEYAAHVVDVFADVWRVLRDDGTLWLNLGDTYTANRRNVQDPHVAGGNSAKPGYRRSRKPSDSRPGTPAGLKEKELVGIPWRVVFALQDAGWYLRAENIWRKLGGMPESVKDRPSRNHETIFLLAKKPLYYYDRHAVAEPVSGYARDTVRLAGGVPSQRPLGDNFSKQRRHEEGLRTPTTRAERAALLNPSLARNKRTVWDMPTANFPGAHYAVFPNELPLTCIRAGTSEHGACASCAAPYKRLVEERSLDRNELPHDHPEWRPSRYDDGKAGDAQSPGAGQRFAEVKTVGWEKTCRCDTDQVVPAVVLDPFFGAGTTGLVARKLGRCCVGIEASEESCALAADRLKQESLFAGADA